MYLMVEFPRVVHKDTDYAIVYFEKDGDEPTQVSLRGTFVITGFIVLALSTIHNFAITRVPYIVVLFLVAPLPVST